MIFLVWLWLRHKYREVFEPDVKTVREVRTVQGGGAVWHQMCTACGGYDSECPWHGHGAM